MSDCLWPYRKGLEPGEAFSSWFSRLALGNGLTPQELYRIAMPGARMYRTDLDRTVPDELLANLAERTGVRKSDLEHATFRRWHGVLIDGMADDAKHPWLPASSCHARTQSHGQQYCPECLADDDTPFLRLEWRLAFTTTCNIHRSLLRDRCPRCSAAVVATYATLGTRTVADCWKCGFDLRQAPPIGAVNRHPSPAHEQRFVRILQDGWATLGPQEIPIHAVLFFSVLWHLYRMVAAGRFARPLRATASEWSPDLSAAIPVPAIKQVERHTPTARRLLLAVSNALLDDWPNRFVHAAERAGISSGDILKDRRNQPFALVTAVERHLAKPLRAFSEPESRAALSILDRSKIPATVAAMRALTGHKIGKLETEAQPAAQRVEYGSHRYWKLDGIAPTVRAKAKRAAVLDGDNIGPWVEKAIIAILAQRADSDIL